MPIVVERIQRGYVLTEIPCTTQAEAQAVLDKFVVQDAANTDGITRISRIIITPDPNSKSQADGSTPVFDPTGQDVASVKP